MLMKNIKWTCIQTTAEVAEVTSEKNFKEFWIFPTPWNKLVHAWVQTHQLERDKNAKVKNVRVKKCLMKSGRKPENYLFYSKARAD
jgi:hypothetical protein